MWANFVEKSYTKCDGETSPRAFSEKIKIERIESLIQFVFIVCPCWGLSKYIETKLLRKTLLW